LDYGFQAYQQRSSIVMRNQTFALNGENRINFEDAAVYAEIFYRSKLGAFMLGGRLESHTFSKAQFAPRLAYSKIFKVFYMKAMFSEAFKIPTLQNFNNSDPELGLADERVMMYEATFGAAWKNKINGELSVYHTQIYNPIAYVYEESNESYQNRLKAGTEGLDAWIQLQGEKTKFKLSATYYRAILSSNFAELEVHANSKAYWGMPNYRVAMYVTKSFEKQWSLQLAAMMQDVFYADYRPDEFVRNGPVLNISVHKSSDKIKNLRFNIGVTNLMNSQVWIGSPYATELTVMPVYQRQLCFSAQYKLD
jgi:outer membrane cobalamin receptor